MSKAYELISESLNEIIRDLEETDGKNLRRETLFLETSSDKKRPDKNNLVDNKTRRSIRILDECLSL